MTAFDKPTFATASSAVDNKSICAWPQRGNSDRLKKVGNTPTAEVGQRLAHVGCVPQPNQTASDFFANV